jgi:uncharacterized protein YbjT (DUF2867 family)
MTRTIAIAGASGWLGQKIAAAVLDAGASPRLLLRGGEHHPKAAHLAPLVARGAQIVPADLSEPASLGTALAGADVIVSALQGGPDTIIDGQRALAAAGKAEGVVRIFPSDFAVDFSAIPVEDHLFLGWRKLAQAAIADTGLPQTNTYIGAFTEMLRQPFFGLVDWDRAVVTHWGEADQSYDFTTTDDTARVAAAAALADTPVDGPLRFAGDTRSPAEIAAIASSLTGRPFSLHSLGDIGTLRDRIAAQRKEAPDTPYAWVGLQYHLAMASGAGKLKQVLNGNFPEVAPTSVERFLARSL